MIFVYFALCFKKISETTEHPALLDSQGRHLDKLAQVLQKMYHLRGWHI